MKKIFFCLGLGLLAGMSACKTGKKAAACDPNVACTMMYVSVGAQVVNSAGQPVVFDEVYTQRENTTEKIQLQHNSESGSYIVLDDSYQKKLANQTANFHFIGMKNGQKVMDEVYRIGADCCHIKKESGKETITLP